VSGTTRVSQYQKGKNIWIYWSKKQWVAVVSAGPYANLHVTPDRITMPASHHSVFYRPDALPAAQPKYWRQIPPKKTKEICPFPYWRYKTSKFPLDQWRNENCLYFCPHPDRNFKFHLRPPSRIVYLYICSNRRRSYCRYDNTTLCITARCCDKAKTSKTVLHFCIFFTNPHFDLEPTISAESQWNDVFNDIYCPYGLDWARLNVPPNTL